MNREIDHMVTGGENGHFMQERELCKRKLIACVNMLDRLSHRLSLVNCHMFAYLAAAVVVVDNF